MACKLYLDKVIKNMAIITYLYWISKRIFHILLKGDRTLYIYIFLKYIYILENYFITKNFVSKHHSHYSYKTENKTKFFKRKYI